MNGDQFGRDQRDYIRFRESDSSDDWTKKTGSSESNGSFIPHRKSQGRFNGPNRFGEERIRHDSYQDQYREGFDPTFEDEYGMKHPYEHGGRFNRWSDDFRSESSHESHVGKGPRGYIRSDERIKEEVCEILTNDYELDASGIEIELKDRVLILKGEVDNRRDKRLAESLVEDILGIDDVHNLLKIKKSQNNGWTQASDAIDETGGRNG